MTHVPHAPAEAQETRTLVLSTDRAVFVWVTEARDVFATLASLAEDAARPPSQRRHTRAEARRRLAEARTALAWLDGATLPGEPVPAPSCQPAGRFEGWAE